MRQEFLDFLKTRYEGVKTEFPGEGRRRWQLRALQDFWRNPSPPSPSNVETPMSLDSDPYDPIALDTPEMGLLIRTDFANEEAWQAFVEKLSSSEKEFAEEQASSGPGDGEGEGADESDDEEDEEDDDNASPPPIIKVVNPTSPEHRAAISNISNLTALRLFNDVDIRPAPELPAQTKRISPPNPLVDCYKWQEIYSGKNLWIYDALSNTDQCARQVSQHGHSYGTATGDSWRARVGHICELQFNMTCLGMKIDFGDLDRWDYVERKRNLDEAALPLPL